VNALAGDGGERRRRPALNRITFGSRCGGGDVWCWAGYNGLLVGPEVWACVLTTQHSTRSYSILVLATNKLCLFLLFNLFFQLKS
jgi:hypothetical protein